MPAAKAPQKKPGPKPAAKPAKEKKPSAKELEQARELARQALHRTRMLRAYLLGVLTLVALALALIPGQSAWLAAHDGLWSLAGVTLLPWLGIALYICSLWLRNRSLRDAWLTLLCQALLLLFLGAAVFVLTHGGEALAGDWWSLVMETFEGETARNGGFFASMLGAGLSMACGQAAAAIITLLLTLAALPMALPPLQRAIFSGAAGRWGEDAPPPPEKAEREKPEKPARGALGDELEELDQIGREHGLKPKGPFKRGQEIPLEVSDRIPTVADISPLPSADDDAAGGIAENLAPGATKRKKAQQAGEEARLKYTMPTAKDSEEDDSAYQPPPISCLAVHQTGDTLPLKGEEERVAYALQKTLSNFGVSVNVTGHSRGPAVTRYEIKPDEGVKISKITSLADDIALHLSATKVRIEAPIPGMPAVGVEIPNRKRAIVSLREIVESEAYRAGTAKSKLTVALGKDIVGSLVTVDLAKLPHLLIAGTTGSGKSVCMNALIMSLMYNASPDDVKLIMIDPKQVEFNVYNGIPHLPTPVVSDPIKAAGALGWAVNEMEHRYGRISERNVRDIDSYNYLARQDSLEHMPRVVIFIDELSDLMMVAPGDVEDCIQRLSQKGRAAGMHLVVATQRPSVDVITGVIKSNLPGRIALSVASQIDSRTIINSMGAEQLLGNGDMLFSMNGGNSAIRVQGCFVSDAEVRSVVDYVKKQDQNGAGYDSSIGEDIDRFSQTVRGKKKGGSFDLSGEDSGEEDDPMLDAAIEVVVNAQLASTTMLQKKLKLGYARASRLVDLLEDRGVVGPPEGAKPRKVLMSHAQWQEYSAMGPGKRSFGGAEE